MAEITFLNPLTGKRETAQKVSSVSSYGVSTPDKSEQTYTITTKDKQYTIGQKAIDWIRNRYVQSFDGYYAYDDEDQLNKSQGYMPRSFQQGYKNNDWDRQLLDLGLPSSKYLNQYLEEYYTWYGDGQYYQPDKEESSYIKSQAQKHWTYTNSPEDLQRKIAGQMPVKEEAKYKDKNGNFLSYKDEMYFSMGLPPSSEIDSYAYMYADHLGKENRVNQFYAAASNNAIDNLLVNGIKNDDTLYTQADGTKAKGRELWEKAYYNFINGDEWADIRSWVQPDGEDDTFKADPYWSFGRTQEEQMAWEAKQNAKKAAADDPYRIDPSYDDFIAFFDEHAKEVYTQKTADAAVAKTFGTVGDYFDAAHEEQVVAMYADITDETALTEYLNSRPSDADPAQIIRDLRDGGVSKSILRKAKNALLDKNYDAETQQAIKDAFKEPRIIKVTDEDVSGDGAIKAVSIGQLFKGDELFDTYGKQMEEDYKASQNIDMDYDKMYTIFESSLDFDENGLVSSDSVEAAVMQLAAAGAAPKFIEDVAAGVINANALILGDGIQQQGASGLMEVVRQATDEADRMNRKRYAEQYRVAAQGKITNFEYDQMLRRMGWDDILDDETATRNYYESKGIAWDAISAEDQAALVQNFSETKMVNDEIDKNAAEVAADYVGGRWLQNLALGLASGTVGVVDMLAGIGSTRDQWEITETLAQAYQWSASYGKSDQSIGFKLLNAGTTIANELIRMSTLGGVGKKAVTGATKLFNKGIANTIAGTVAANTPFIANAMGSYYNEAMASGATRKDATVYATVAGTFEGAVEKLNMDMWASKALGSNNLAKTVMKGGKGFSTAGLDKKARMIHMAASALGEFGEESASYAMSSFMQRCTYNEDAQFDFGEMIESGMMGAVIGFIGAGMNAGSYNASNIVAEHMNEHGYDSDFFDIMHASVQVESMSQKQYERYSESNEWLTYDDFQSVQRDLVSHSRQLESSKQNYATAQEKINSEVQLKVDAVEAIRSQIAAIYDGTQQLTPDSAKELGKLMEALRVAESELATERAQAENKLSELQSGYKETTAQHRAAIEKAQAKLDAHNVALYNTFLPDIAAIRGMSAAQIERSNAERRLQDVYTKFDTAYRSDTFYEGMFDEMDAASDDAALAYSNLAQADAALAATAGTADQVRAKIRRVRQKNRQAYEAGIAEAQAAQQEQTQAAEQTQEPPTQQPTVEAPQYVELDDDAITRITELGNKLGRTVVVEDLPDGVNGRYDGDGILHINRKQLSNGDSPELIVFKHELTHSLETSKRYYNSLARFVEQYAKDSFVASERFPTFEDQYNAFAEEVRKARAAQGDSTTDEIIKHEFVASFAEGHLFTDEAAINALAKTNANVVSRMLNQVRYWLHRLGIGTTGDRAADDLRQVERLYAMALHNAGVKPSKDVREYMIGSTLGATRAAALGYDIYKFDGSDGFERFYLSDEDADINVNLIKSRKGIKKTEVGHKLSDVLTHPTLFAIYPELQNVRVVYGFNEDNRIHGEFDGKLNIISLNENSSVSRDGVKFIESFMHELQHAVQYIENQKGNRIATGANIDYAKNYLSIEALKKTASLVASGELSKDDAIHKAAVDIRKVLADDNAARAVYEDDLGETEARTTGRGYVDTLLYPDQIDADYLADEAASLHSKIPPFVIGENYDGSAIITDAIEKLGLVSLDNLQKKADSGDINADERVILDAAIKSRNLRESQVKRSATPRGGAGSVQSDLEDDRRGAAGTVQSVQGNGSSTSGNYGGVQASSREHRVLNTWDGYFASDADASEYSTGISWDDLGSRYGVHEQGMQPRVREANVPLSTDGDNATSKVLRTFGESPQLDSQNVQDFQDAIIDDGLGTYTPQTNAELQDKATGGIINAGGVGKAQELFKAKVLAGKINDQTIAEGMQLLAEASARGDWNAQLDIISSLCIAGTESGRAVQAFRMLKKMGAAGAAYYMEKVEEKLNVQYADEIASGKMQPFRIPPELMNNLANAKNTFEIEAAEEEISKYFGQNMPLSFGQAIQNWRYFAMLANPTTHMRNVVGNAMMAGARGVKNAIAAGIESAVVSQENRTHAVYSKSKHSAEIALAEQAAKDNWKDITASGGKYGIDQEISKYQRKSNVKWLDKAMSKNFDLMGKEDEIFLRSAYIDAYTQYLVAQGIDPAKITKEQAAEAHNIAFKEAHAATFRDASALATWLNRVPNGAAKLFLQGALPFVKTPINVAKRGVEYSPAGLIRGVQMAADIMAKGDGSKYTVSQAVDRIATGTTGTALAAIGFWLAKAGILRGTGDEDEEVETFLTATGDKNYSFNFSFGGKEYAMDASGLAPINIPLFLGVATYEVMSRDSGERASLSDFTALVSGITDPMMEMSFLSSLDSTLSAYNSADSVGGSLGAVAWNAAKSYASQFLPSFAARTADLVDPTQRTTAGDATSAVGTGMDQFGRSLVNKVPAATFALEPKIDVKGQKNISRGFADFALDFANAYILPGKITVKNRDSVDRELVEIAANTGNANFLPEVATRKYFTYNKQKYTMNASQFTSYQRDLGEQVYAALKKVMARPDWDKMTDGEKASLLEDAKSAAEKSVKEKYLDILGAYDN